MSLKPARNDAQSLPRALPAHAPAVAEQVQRREVQDEHNKGLAKAGVELRGAEEV